MDATNDTGAVKQRLDTLPHAWDIHIIQALTNHYEEANAINTLHADWSAEWSGWEKLSNELTEATTRSREHFLEIAPTYTKRCFQQFWSP